MKPDGFFHYLIYFLSDISFSSFSKGLKELCDWLAKYGCSKVCMESTSKYWIPVFNISEKANISVILAHPKYTKPQKGNKTDRKEARWICERIKSIDDCTGT